MEIYFCTGNQSKIDEANLFVAQHYPTISFKMDKIHFSELQSLSQEEILLHKMAQKKDDKFPFIIDETGIFFEEFHDFPGTLTKFIFKSLGYEGIKRLLINQNSAFYKTTILYSNDGKNYSFHTGIVHGQIRFDKTDLYNKNFPFSSIFIPDGFSKPLTELEENRDFLDHRKLAIKKLITSL